MKEPLNLLGFEVGDFDTANGTEYDLVDDATWDPFHERIVTS